MNGVMTEESLSLLRDAVRGGSREDILRAAGFDTTLGLVAYDLEPAAKKLYPVLTPLRNKIPRVGGGTGTAVHWKAITSLNAGRYNPGVTEGKRNEIATTSEKDYTASFATIGVDDSVTYEAQAAGQGFDDVKALAALGMLNRMMILEERTLIGGNATKALGQVAGVTTVDVTTGGSIPQTTTLKVYVAPLTHQGLMSSTFQPTGNGQDAAVADSFLTALTRTPQGASSPETLYGYVGLVSTVSSVTTATDGLSTHSIEVSWTAIPGAVAYALFWGPTTGAGALFGAISYINSYVITTAVGASTVSGMAADNANMIGTDRSKNARVFDGLISLIAGAGQGDLDVSSGAIITTLATGTPGVGTFLTSDGSGGIVEFDAILKQMYDNNKVSCDEIMMGTQALQDATRLVVGGGAAPLFRFNLDRGAGAMDQASQAKMVLNGMVGGGTVVAGYLSKFGYAGPVGIPITLHPDLPSGTVLFVSYRLPYPQSGISNVLDVYNRREYYEINWPQTERQYPIGVYAEEVLRMRAGFALGMICNLAKLA